MPVYSAEELGGRQAASSAVQRGKAIRIATGLYSDETRRAPADIVAAHWMDVVGKLLPGAVVTDRSGFVLAPKNGLLFVDHKRVRELVLLGLTVIPSGNPNAAPMPGDTPTAAGLYLASEQRALLDNLRPSRAVKGRPARTLSRNELHDEIVRLSTSRTPTQRQRLLDRVIQLGESTGRQGMAESVNVFFQAAAGDRPTVESGSRAMKSAQAGQGYDAVRLRVFQSLVTALAQQLTESAPKPRPEPHLESRIFLPFFEAYFSNYIEGTEFTVEEAASIALDGVIPSDRPEDAHDVVGTYRIVNDLDGLREPTTTADDFLDVLRFRHAAVMEGRPKKKPGQFKTRANRAGMTEFVSPEAVEGTLRAGWGELERLDDPFARAVFIMFLVAEVHPFDDGNGRTARIMMNSELVRHGESRVIIPTVIRDEYLSGLTAMTHNGRASALVSVVDFAQRYTRAIDFTEFDAANQSLTETNAFLTTREAEQQMVRLELPKSRR